MTIFDALHDQAGAGPPSAAGDGDLVTLTRQAARWEGLGRQHLQMTSAAWSRAGRELDEGRIPLLIGGGDDYLSFFFPDGIAVEVGQRYYDRNGDRCSCGATTCRHQATVLRALGENRFRRSWRVLGSEALGGTGADAPTASTRPEPVVTGLVMSLGAVQGSWSGAPREVTVRPSRRTRQGTWRRNLAWGTVVEGLHLLPAAQQDVLRTLGRMRGPGERGIRLEETGPEVWTLLDAAREAGLELATDGSLELSTKELGVAVLLELTDGGIVLRTAPDWPDGAPASSWRELGDPTHALLAGAEEAPTLYRLRSAPSVRSLLSMGETWVPEADGEDFAHRVLPQLLEDPALRVLGDVDALTSAVLPLTLHLSLRRLGDEGARLTWSWDYGVPGMHGHVRHLLRPDPEAERRPRAEAQLLLEIQEGLRGLEQWISFTPRELDPASTCEFSLGFLDALQQHPRVRVDLEGDDFAFTPVDAPEVDWEIQPRPDRDWLGLAGIVRIGDRHVTVGQLIHALRTGYRYLVVGGEYIDLTTEQMQALRELLETSAALPDAEGLQINRHDQGLWDSLAELGAFETTARRWRELLADVLPRDLSEEPLDEAVRAELRPYQLEGYRWLSARWDVGLGGLLADEMGLGKTLQLLAAVRRHRRTDERPVLVAAPRSVLSTWAEQAAQFTPDLRTRVVTGTLREPLDPSDADLVIVSHHLLRLDAEKYSALEWAAVIVDEAQAAKNPLSQLHKVLRTLHRDVTWAVTGTPVENSLQDLWALAALVAPGLLPPLKEFTVRWRRPIERGRNPRRLAQLRARLAPILLRRTKELVAADLPPKLENTLHIPLQAATVTRYTGELNKERQRILGLLDDPDRNRVEILAALTRLRLLAADPGTLASPSAKSRALLERLQELAGSGHRALVFSQFTRHLMVTREILEAHGITTSYLDGSTRHRDRVIAEFRDGDQDVFLISTTAGGSGLTLTEADYVFLLDPWWNPAVEEQAIDRTHRIGQDSTVTVYRLVSAETIEEKVLALQDEKRELIDAVLDPDAAVTTAIDAVQIQALLTE